MNLQELKSCADKKAALLNCDDETLDRLAAEVQGWRIRRVREYEFGGWLDCWHDEKRVNQEAEKEYEPSRDLNQAYALLEKCCEAINAEAFTQHNEDGLFNIDIIKSDSDSFVADVYLSEAGSHARAVTILAILGLLEAN